MFESPLVPCGNMFFFKRRYCPWVRTPSLLFSKAFFQKPQITGTHLLFIPSEHLPETSTVVRSYIQFNLQLAPVLRTPSHTRSNPHLQIGRCPLHNPSGNPTGATQSDRMQALKLKSLESAFPHNNGLDKNSNVNCAQAQFTEL